MLPTIEIDVGGTTHAEYDRCVPVDLVFRINGHRFSFRGTSAEIFTMERDLNELRKLLNGLRVARQAGPTR